MESSSATTSGGALSKGLLQMKFMQKTASKLQQVNAYFLYPLNSNLMLVLQVYDCKSLHIS